MSQTVQVKICPKCSSPNSLDAATCPRCGHQFRTQFTHPGAQPQSPQGPYVPPTQGQYAQPVQAPFGYRYPALAGIWPWRHIIALLLAIAALVYFWALPTFLPPIIGTWKKDKVYLTFYANKTGKIMLNRPADQVEDTFRNTSDRAGQDQRKWDWAAAPDGFFTWKLSGNLLFLHIDGREVDPDPFTVRYEEGNQIVSMGQGGSSVAFYRVP